MATKINAADVNVMTFNADPFVASDEYGEEELQEILNEAYITELNGFDADGLREDAASFDEDEEALAERLNDIADTLDKMSENEILVVFNDVPELTYDK